MKEYPITVSAEDHSGELSPIVLDAMSKGAISRNHADDKSSIEIVFSKKADAHSFAKAVEAIGGEQTIEPNAKPANLFDDGWDAGYNID
jgi:hypothetical protein